MAQSITELELLIKQNDIEKDKHVSLLIDQINVIHKKMKRISNIIFNEYEIKRFEIKWITYGLLSMVFLTNIVINMRILFVPLVLYSFFPSSTLINMTICYLDFNLKTIRHLIVIVLVYLTILITSCFPLISFEIYFSLMPIHYSYIYYAVNIDKKITNIYAKIDPYLEEHILSEAIKLIESYEVDKYKKIYPNAQRINNIITSVDIRNVKSNTMDYLKFIHDFEKKLMDNNITKENDGVGIENNE